MRLIRRTQRFGTLLDVCTFECRGCGVSHFEEHEPLIAANTSSCQSVAKRIAGRQARNIEADLGTNQNARNDNHAIQPRGLQCPLPLNQSRGWAGNG
jgi:hypothetical protein